MPKPASLSKNQQSLRPLRRTDHVADILPNSSTLYFRFDWGFWNYRFRHSFNPRFPASVYDLKSVMFFRTGHRRLHPKSFAPFPPDAGNMQESILSSREPLPTQPSSSLCLCAGREPSNRARLPVPLFQSRQEFHFRESVSICLPFL